MQPVEPCQQAVWVPVFKPTHIQQISKTLIAAVQQQVHTAVTTKRSYSVTMFGSDEEHTPLINMTLPAIPKQAVDKAWSLCQGRT